MKETAIADYAGYCSGMKKSLEDKMFFEDWLDGITHVVDFGCADGTLLTELHERRPELTLTGIDANELMLKKIPIECEKVRSNLPVFDNRTRPAVTALNLSSVLHEVYSYGSDDYIDMFWASINHAKRYKYVFIRDMMYEPFVAPGTESMMLSKEEIEQLRQWSRNIYNFGDQKQIEDFEYYQGTLACSKKNMVHFLLKYRYTQNWEREVKENYLAVDKEEIFRQLSNYDCVYFNQYAMPFLHDRIKEDFDIDFNEMTHVKMVFKLREG